MDETGRIINGRLNITNIGVDPVDVDGAARKIVSIITGRKNGTDSAGDAQTPGGVDMPGADNAGGIHAPDTDNAGGIRAPGTESVAEPGGAYTSGGAECGAGPCGARHPAYACTPNAEFMMDAQKDGEFMHILNGADLVVPDGAGVVLAARLLGYGRIARAPGFDLTKKLLLNPAEYPFSFYFLGGKPGVAENAAKNIIKESPETRITGCHDGYFDEACEPDIVAEINESGADILLVAFGAPKAEKWIYKNREKLQVSMCMGIGGTIDILAGVKKPAPPFFRAHGLEWLYRLYREPWRAKRMLKLPQFILFAIKWKLSGRPGVSKSG